MTRSAPAASRADRTPPIASASRARVVVALGSAQTTTSLPEQSDPGYDPAGALTDTREVSGDGLSGDPGLEPSTQVDLSTTEEPITPVTDPELMPGDTASPDPTWDPSLQVSVDPENDSVVAATELTSLSFPAAGAPELPLTGPGSVRALTAVGALLLGIGVVLAAVGRRSAAAPRAPGRGQ